jgi:preprotein translocase subunit SecF
VFAGTYSSLFIASPIVIDFAKFSKKKENKEHKKVSAVAA